ncbi:MAG TPA: flagellar protein FlaG [Defluviitaleaceae bacterium]|jgi:flagellar protein FlaG|nr:flagellar protein FlaG [Candidatus Epulonipiscium sp.]HQD49574.1 flagellar protein FlaG [Defluviitaleaceae bacterium]
MKVENSVQTAQMTMQNIQNQKYGNLAQEQKLDNNQVVGQKQKSTDSNLTIAEKTVIEAIERANKKLSGVFAEFEFSIHEKTKQISIKVINKETKEIIREIPPEQVLDMVAHLWEMAGIILDEKR